MRTDFTSMTGAELVTSFNDMVTKAEVAGIDRFKPVQRFGTRDKGITRCSTLYLVLSRAGVRSAEKPKQSAKAKTPKTNGKAGTIHEEFCTREGSKREALLGALHSHLGKPVAEKALLKEVYGNQDEGNKGALAMCMKGLYASIEKGKLPYNIVRSKEGKEVYFELQAVK